MINIRELNKDFMELLKLSQLEPLAMRVIVYGIILSLVGKEEKGKTFITRRYSNTSQSYLANCAYA